MSRGRLEAVSFVVMSCVVALGGRGFAVAAPGSPPPRPADEDLNDRGVEMRRVGNDKAARDLFQQAYDMTHSPRATAQLGIAYQALGRWELAEPLVEKALESPDDPWIKKYLDPLQTALETIKRHVARIEMTGEPAGAEVVVNGASVGHFPLPGPITVAIGTVDIRVRAAGFQPEVRKLNMAVQQYERVFVQLDRDPSAAGAVSRPASAGRSSADATGTGRDPNRTSAPDMDQSTVSQARRVLKWGSLGLAAVGLGTGVVATVLHEQKLTDFRNADGGRCRDMDGRGVDEMTGLPVVACQGLLDDYQGARTWQIVGFAAAGVFAATWLVLQLTEPAATPARPLAAWTCVPSLDRPGATCALRF
jgi:hypothetical protein